MVHAQAVNFFCVRTGDKYPDEYVAKLRNMVHTHCTVRHTFNCITDHEPTLLGVSYHKATLPGWWAKVELFKLRRPLIYFDLDVVITGDLTPLLEWEGFGIIKLATDKAKAYSNNLTSEIVTPVFNSSVMKLTGNEYHVWDQFKPVVMERFKKGGDQRWITARMLDARTFPDEWFPSYKWGNAGGPCEDRPRDGSIATIFHGHPKPEEFESGWVADNWQ